MFDIGWTEMLVIAVVMIVVVGPKDLPAMLRTFGKTTSKLRSMAGDFQRQFNEALKEAELDDVKKSVDSLRSLNPVNEIKKQLNPFEKAAADVRAGLDTLKPQMKQTPASEPQATEPLKSAGDLLAGVAGPDKMPEPAVFPVMTEGAVTPPTANGPAVASAPLSTGPALSKPAAAPNIKPLRKAPAAVTATALPTAKPKREAPKAKIAAPVNGATAKAKAAATKTTAAKAPAGVAAGKTRAKTAKVKDITS